MIYINEANIATYTQTDYGGGYDGYTKKLSISEIASRPSAGRPFKAYIYFENSFKDYWYWDFDYQGTEDWNAIQALNQGIYANAYWQLGTSFSDNSIHIGKINLQEEAFWTEDAGKAT